MRTDLNFDRMRYAQEAASCLDTIENRPYNIVESGENGCRITSAVAGFSRPEWKRLAQAPRYTAPRRAPQRNQHTSVRDLIPWGRNNGNRVPNLFRDDDRDPFLSLHREVNRLFDDVFRGLGPGLAPFAGSQGVSAGWPSVEISETDKEIKITAEVPGLEEKDIEVLLDDGVLTLKGEKRSETEDKDRQFSERYYGHFERRIPLVAEVREEEIDASFGNGVLTVTLPKDEKAQSQVKRIAIRH